MSTSEKEIKYKMILLGDSSVGKTCILRRFVENKFLKSHLATIGIDFRTKVLHVCGKDIKLKNHAVDKKYRSGGCTGYDDKTSAENRCRDGGDKGCNS